jgi:hypothetical protein
MTDLWGALIPTWLSSVGTIGAFATGGVLIVREMRRDRDREEQDRRQKAGVVAAWLIRTETRTASLATIESRLKVNNAGTEPVYDVEVRYIAPITRTVVTDQLGVMPPGEHTLDLPAVIAQTWIQAEDGWILRSGNQSSTASDPHREPWKVDVELRFTDPTGQRWHRNSRGALKPLPV